MNVWTFQYLLVVLTFLFTLILVSKVLRGGRAPGGTIAWLLIIVLVPYVGIPLYLVLGDRKVRLIAGKKTPLYERLSSPGLLDEMSSLERILMSSGFPAKSSRNQLKPLSTGEAAYRDILVSLKNAESSIHIATYILGNDPVGKSILSVLCKKAANGVEVKLLLDGVGSFWFPRYLLRQLRKAGGAYSFFVPLFHVPFSGHSNLRNHRKMVLVDGKKAILGGMNLAEKYMGSPSDLERWVDFSFSVCGEIIRDFENLFLSDWSFATGKYAVLTPSPSPWEDFNAAQTPIQFIASGPDVKGDPLYEVLLTEIFIAKKRIWIATPYFIPDESLARALELACRRGVDVQIFVPSRSNHPIADLCRTSYLRQIHAAGGTIHLFGPNMMHSKMILMDDDFALIGSSNLDMRSLFYNYEVGVILSSKPEVQMIADEFGSLLKFTRLSHFIDHQGYSLIEGIGRIIGPLL